MTKEQSPAFCPVPAYEAGTHPLVMLGVRFLLELVAFGAIGWAGWEIGDGGITGGLLAGLMAVAAMAIWGALTVPGDPARNPEPVIVVPGWARLLVELAVFGVAAWLLWVSVSRAASESFLTAVDIAFVGWDRTWWLLRQR